MPNDHTSRPHKIHTSLSQHTFARVKLISKEWGLTQSELLRLAIHAYIRPRVNSINRKELRRIEAFLEMKTEEKTTKLLTCPKTGQNSVIHDP